MVKERYRPRRRPARFPTALTATTASRSISRSNLSCFSGRLQPGSQRAFYRKVRGKRTHEPRRYTRQGEEDVLDHDAEVGVDVGHAAAGVARWRRGCHLPQTLAGTAASLGHAAAERCHGPE